MSAVEIALPRLRTEESFRSTAYRDTNNKLTIGYGFCVDEGISQFAASALCQAQAAELHQMLLRYNWYATLDEARQSVCLDIAFNEGLGGLLRFPKMIAALSRQGWEDAAAECKVQDPKLAGRYAALAQILLTGVA